MIINLYENALASLGRGFWGLNELEWCHLIHHFFFFAFKFLYLLPTATSLNKFRQSPLFNHQKPPSSCVAHDLPFITLFPLLLVSAIIIRKWKRNFEGCGKDGGQQKWSWYRKLHNWVEDERHQKRNSSLWALGMYIFFVASQCLEYW